MKHEETEKAKETKDHTMRVDFELEVRDKNGKLLSITKGKSHTWVRNYIRILREHFYNQNGVSNQIALTDTAGASSNGSWGLGATSTQHNSLGVRAAAAADAYGIQVGTLDTAYSRTQYQLAAKISHGSTGTQLLYGVVTVEEYSETNGTARFRVLRTFTNSSGSSITVKEIDIVTSNQAGATYYYYMMCRDVLVSPQVIPDAATLTVRYTISISYV